LGLATCWRMVILSRSTRLKLALLLLAYVPLLLDAVLAAAASLARAEARHRVRSALYVRRLERAMRRGGVPPGLAGELRQMYVEELRCFSPLVVLFGKCRGTEGGAASTSP